MERIYLDWNATSPLFPEVKAAVIEGMELTGNASSIHHDGQRARSVIERARRTVAKAVGSAPQGLFFTTGATESNNQILKTHAEFTDDAFIVCSSVEHPSVIEVVENLQCETLILDVDRNGRLDLAAFESFHRPPTLVSMMWANNEIGNVYPIHTIRERLPEETLLHVDGTQAWGRIPIDFQGAGIDVMSLSFHKMGGPKGIGAVVVREGLRVESLLHGGHQERGRRPGTENVPAAHGVNKVATLVLSDGSAWHDQMEGLRSYFLEQLVSTGLSFTVRGDSDSRLPNTINLAFSGIDGEDLLLSLDLAGVSMSSGSACTAGSLEPSHVVLAMGYEAKSARESVRVSLGPSTTEEELKRACEILDRCVRNLQRVGPTR